MYWESMSMEIKGEIWDHRLFLSSFKASSINC